MAIENGETASEVADEDQEAAGIGSSEDGVKVENILVIDDAQVGWF